MEGDGMDFYVEPSPAGGWNVRLRGTPAPVSRHDTEEDAEQHSHAYAHGAHEWAAAELRVDPDRVIVEPVRLRDGSTVLIRSVTSGDKPLIAAAFGHLSEHSRYQRFIETKPSLTPAELVYFTEIDHHNHEALGAIDPARGTGVGVARFVRLPDDPTRAEAAVAVIDEWQGRGLGTVLLERLTARAEEEGIERFTATLLVENRAMLSAFRRIGAVKVRQVSGSVQEIDIDLPIHAGAEITPKQVMRAIAAGGEG